jgi:hypothetical protein
LSALFCLTVAFKKWIHRVARETTEFIERSSSEAIRGLLVRQLQRGDDLRRSATLGDRWLANIAQWAVVKSRPWNQKAMRRTRPFLVCQLAYILRWYLTRPSRLPKR